MNGEVVLKVRLRACIAFLGARFLAGLLDGCQLHAKLQV